MKIGKRRKVRPVFVFLMGVCALALICYPFISRILHPVKYIKSPERILNLTAADMEEGEVLEDTVTVTRGTSVTVEEKGEKTSKVKLNGQTLNVPNEYLAGSLKECVDIDTIYPRKLVNLRESRGGKLSDVAVEKGEALQVVNVLPSDLNLKTGEISWFEVEKDGQNYFVAGTNMETTKANAMKTYVDGLQYQPIYDSVFGDGYSKDAYITQADFRGSTQPDFPDNPRRDDIQAINITLDTLLNQKDYLYDLKNSTGINALVIALKGIDGQLVYESEVPAKYFNDPTKPLQHPYLSKQQMKDLISELKSQGFYIIGRMETFADSALATDHPEWAITGPDGSPYLLSEDYWLSAYSRDAWMYNGDLAKEFADLGVNEVQFDFVRFADAGTNAQADGLTDYHNTYNESKVSAIQGFLYYMREELEPLHVYTAADSYGGPVMDNNDYDIGHYYPALLAAANVVCPMVYLDSFPSLVPDKKDSNDPQKDALLAFTKASLRTETSMENPGVCRVWLQGYGDITGSELKSQIQGIMEAGSSGYMLWTDRGMKDDLESIKSGYIDSTELKRKKEEEAAAASA